MSYDEVTEAGAWALTNLLRGKKPPAIEVIFEAVETVGDILKSHGEDDVLEGCCWALVNVADDMENGIGLIVD